MEQYRYNGGCMTLDDDDDHSHDQMTNTIKTGKDDAAGGN